MLIFRPSGNKHLGPAGLDPHDVCAHIYIFSPHSGGKICSILIPLTDTHMARKKI